MFDRRAPVLVVVALSLAACAGPAGVQPSPSTTPDHSRTASPTQDEMAPGDKTTPSDATPTAKITRAEASRTLLRAASSNDLDAARRALAAKADVEVRNADRRTPLIIASLANHVAMAKLLLEAGADPDAKDEIEDSAFLYAGAEGHNEILRLTLRYGADVTSTNRFGGTALIPASEHGHTETVRILIDAGVPLDHVNNLGWTAMLEAVVLGNGSADHADVVRQLVGAGADESIPDRKGKTPRQLAVAAGHHRILAVIDDADRIRTRAEQLIEAARDGDVDGVRRLLQRKASVSARDRSGATALVAAAYGNRLRVARLLLAAGADPNVKDETVQSAYLISTSEVGDDPRLLRLLLERGADVGSLDSWKGTGLIRAADRGFADIVSVLLETDIAKDHVNRIGFTALHEAVVLGDGGRNHQRTVQRLVEAGVDTTIKDSSGRTALQSARERGYTEIADLLE